MLLSQEMPPDAEAARCSLIGNGDHVLVFASIVAQCAWMEGWIEEWQTPQNLRETK